MLKKYLLLLLLILLLLSVGGVVLSQSPNDLVSCRDFAFSTEEDFLSRGPVPPDGNPIISDGDLLGKNHAVCMRNRDLLDVHDVDPSIDLGLDAADVLYIDRKLVAFSTSLDAPGKRFTAGDLLTTWGAVIPNQALLVQFQIHGDRGLDAVHFVGDWEHIIAFNSFAIDVPRGAWLENPGLLVDTLRRYNIDIWFSIEGTEQIASTVPVYDGDLLSAAYGVVVARNEQLLPPSVPAGIQTGGVDFGLDAFTASRMFNPNELKPAAGHFSTEILYRGEQKFTDGDVLRVGDGIAYHDSDLTAPFEPFADFLGTDAIYILLDEPPELDFLPMILKYLRGGG
ncbi:MAG TPA: hypothetical protein G4N94_07510 [Caldilineae bacterium]|nr:hypothetical protein [Caldilineae bacterium]